MPPKIQMKIEEQNVYKFRSILNTFSIDEIFIKKKENNKKKKEKKEGGDSGHESQKIKKNQNHDLRKLKFAISENFTNHGESIRDVNRGSRE
jgi:beta-lactamase superfamily II metal-dependent hydrolase